MLGTGVAIGGSVFLGEPGLLDFCFDGLGVFWVLRGSQLLASRLRPSGVSDKPAQAER